MTNYRVTYGSVEEICDVAERHFLNRNYHKGRLMPEWTGVHSLAELRTLAVDGWAKEAAEAMSIAEDAVATVTKDVEMPSFTPLWDVSGCEVDVARYLSGEPENMIDYEPVPVPRNGRVIVLCSSVSVSGGVSTDAIKRRGYAVAALVFALAKMGFNTELWADMTSSKSRDLDSIRVLVKGTNDEIDPARIMFAFAHPGMMRALMMPAMHDWPADKRKANNVGGTYGAVANAIEDLPEGTIYLPSVYSDQAVPDADKALLRHLTDLGIV